MSWFIKIPKMNLDLSESPDTLIWIIAETSHSRVNTEND